MKPTDQLVEEHNSIKFMLEIINNVCNEIESGEKVNPEHLDQIIEFIRVFADKYHHGKEEDLLFGAMVEAGIPREAGPIGVMLMEHDSGRHYVKKMSESVTQYRKGNQKAISTFIDNAREYSSLLTQHIDKEDHILYPMADSYLTEEKQQELLKEFEIVNRDQIGYRKLEELQNILDRLKEIYL